jgi:GalNAc5-diNAcBac-PP-undecaprenol beta-1,3-glucosyltransferase
LPFGEAALTFEDYALGRFRGDLIPLIHRQRFFAAGYRYPDTRVGGEHLLWYRIAADTTIPASSLLVVQVHDDALERLTSGEMHLRRAVEHAELQEETLARFGDALREVSAGVYARRRLGAATFRLLSGDKRRAREHLRRSGLSPLDRRRAGLWGATLLPNALVGSLFLRYRRRQWRRAAGAGVESLPEAAGTAD